MSTNAINYQINEQTVKKAAASKGAATLAFWAGTACITFLAALHFLSPEFEPSWRMVSEYALGKYPAVLSLMFISWAISSWALFFSIRQHVKTLAGKVGLGFLVAAGIGQGMASIFDVTQETMHGVAAMIGIPSLPIAAMLISYSLKRNTDWAPAKKRILWTANLTWISWVLMTISVIVMMAGFQEAGVTAGKPLDTLPDGVISFAGWANRLLIILYCLWPITVSRFVMRLHRKS